MAHGGRRPNSGRKKGSATLKTRAVADKAAAEGITPLEVILEAMRVHHAAKRLDDAAKLASMAAPYIHPRLTSVQLTGKDDGPIVQVIRDESGP